MRAVASLPAVAALALALAAGACTDDDGAKGLEVGNGAPAQVADQDGGAQAPSTGPAPCVERPPNQAPRVNSAGLPCELIPPGFIAPR